jgi:hypothetical protein
MKVLAFSLLLVIVCSKSFSQVTVSFEKGYYTDNSGIRHDGFIKNEPLTTLNSRILFKQNETDEPVTLTVKDVKDFGIGVEVYERLTYDEYNVRTNKTAGKTAFVRVEGKSLLSLYEGSDNNRTIYLLTKDGRVYLLKNDFTESNQLQAFNFKLNIQAATAPCITIDRINKTPFTEKAIKKIVTDYNKCRGDSVSFAMTNSKKVVDYIQPQLLGMNYGNDKKQITVGLVYRRYIPKISDLTSLNLGVYYFNFTHKGGVFTFDPDDMLTLSIISIPFTIQQNFLRGNFRPFIFAGPAVEYVGSIKGNLINEDFLPKGFGKPLGITLTGGAGIEWNVTKELIIKSEYRYEVISQRVTIGLAYNLQLKKNEQQ